MVDFLWYWWGNLCRGWSIGNNVAGLLQGILVLCVACVWIRTKCKADVTWEGAVLKVLGVIFALAFLISTVFVAPFLDHEKANKKYSDLKNDYDTVTAVDERERPYLEPSLMLEEIKGGMIFYRYEVRNTGKTPARRLVQQSRTSNVSLSEIHPPLSDIAPGGKVTVPGPPEPSGTSLNTRLVLEYSSGIKGKETRLRSQFFFSVPTPLSPGEYPYIRSELDVQDNVMIKAQDVSKDLGKVFEREEGSVYFALPDIDPTKNEPNRFAANGGGRVFIFDPANNLAKFTTERNGKRFSATIPIKFDSSKKARIVTLVWGVNGILLGIDGESSSDPPDFNK